MRGTTLVKLLDDLRAEARLSLNPAHNAQNTYTLTFIALTGTPFATAARSLPPIAKR